MQLDVLDPIGARVTDLRLDALDADAVAHLTRLLAEHGVLIAPGQELDDAGFVGFLRSFSELAFTKGETSAPGFPELLNVVSNVGRTTPPRSVFHVDTSYVSRPPAYTALRAVTVPEQGGQTLFSNQYRAYDTLPVELRDRLRGRTVRHVVTGVEPGDEQESEAVRWEPRPTPTRSLR